MRRVEESDLTTRTRYAIVNIQSEKFTYREYYNMFQNYYIPTAVLIIICQIVEIGQNMCLVMYLYYVSSSHVQLKIITTRFLIDKWLINKHNTQTVQYV